MRKVTVWVLVKLFTIKMSAFLPRMIISTAQLNINRFIKLAVEEIVNVYFANTGAIQSLHGSFADAPRPSEENFDWWKFYFTKLQFQIIDVKAFESPAQGKCFITFAISPQTIIRTYNARVSAESHKPVAEPVFQRFII